MVPSGRSRKFDTKNCCSERKRFIHDNVRFDQILKTRQTLGPKRFIVDHVPLQYLGCYSFCRHTCMHRTRLPHTSAAKGTVLPVKSLHSTQYGAVLCAVRGDSEFYVEFFCTVRPANNLVNYIHVTLTPST